MLELKHALVLGSKSPRRKELLSQITNDFTIYSKDVDESFEEIADVNHVASYLAQKKGNEIFPELPENSLLLTADSIVIVNDEILNKPADRVEAIEMLSKLSNTWHEVHTGVALMASEKTVIFKEVSRVLFDELTPEMLAYYVDHFKPFDKAGSYGIQEWIGYVGRKRIEGSYANIMGLPIQRVYRELIDF